MQITGVIFSIISTVNRLPTLPLYAAKIPLPENRQRDFLYVPIRQMWTHSRRTTPSAPTAATILQQSFKTAMPYDTGSPKQPFGSRFFLSGQCTAVFQQTTRGRPCVQA